MSDDIATSVGACDQAERCTSCILPAGARGVHFDRAGVCGLCHAHSRRHGALGHQPPPAGDIEAKVQEIRDMGRSRPYDCLVGLSGGRDSCYLLYLLVRKHKLRCLAAYYRTPFTDGVIDANVHRVVKRLGVPLVTMEIPREFHRDYARKAYRVWEKTRWPEIINLMCAPCKYVNAEVFRIARANNIRAIMYGGSRYEGFQLGVRKGESKSRRHPHSFLSQCILSLSMLKQGIQRLAACPSLIPLLPAGFKAAVLYLNPHTPYLRMRYRDIVRYDYFINAPYDEAECISVITSELGWELPPGCHSYWRADCSLTELKNLLMREAVGATYMDAYLSNMVRAGEITRDEALARLATEGRISEHRLARAADVLDIDLSQPQAKDVARRGERSEKGQEDERDSKPSPVAA